MTTKALVLSGGGPVGIAWETGVLAGLASGGCDLTDADLIVGTSAGSAVGAAIALGRSPAEQLQRQRPGGADTTPPRQEGMAERMQAFFKVLMEAFAEGPSDASRAKIGRFALEAETPPEEAFVGFFADLHDVDFPDRFTCTAVDCETGAFVTWSKASGVPLDRAVASSCAVPGIFPPITIDGRRYMDGGMRSAGNADLAAGHEKVVYINVIGKASILGAMNEAEIAHLRETGSEVEVIDFDEQTAAALGMNLMDASLSPVGAEHGLRQGADAAERLAKFWA